MADMLCGFAHGLSNGKDIPSYSSLLRQEGPGDGRTGAEIKQDVAEQLRRNITERRKGHETI